jgi:hypothetical protein
MDYSDWAFLTFTGRNDWSSTLPTNANSYFYPSAQLAVIFTEAMRWKPSWLDYGKIRLSKAKVGNDAPLYALTTRYNNASAVGADNDQQQNGGPAVTFPFRGITSYISSTSLGNPILKPETTVEDEVGLELRMFGGRARGEVSVYSKSSYNQIFSVPSSPATGFTSISRNAGNLRNKGVELSLGGRPIDTRLFSWDARINWAKNRSEVLSLAPGVTSIFLSGYSWPQIRIMEGQPYGVIWGYGWKKNCVAADPCFKDVSPGTLLIGDDGYPIKSDDQRNLGTVQPDWTGSATSEFSFGRFAVSGLLDIRHGGKLINFETQYETSNGRSILTADRYTWTTWQGVNINSGKPNTKPLFKDQDYYPLIYGTDRAEQQLENAGFAKLREVSVSYRLPDMLSRRMSLQNAAIYVTGRNLRGWYSSPSGDPEQDLSQGTNAGQQYFRQFSAPQTRSIHRRRSVALLDVTTLGSEASNAICQKHGARSPRAGGALVGRMQRFSRREQESQRTGVGHHRHSAARVGGDVHSLDVLRTDGAVGLGVDAAMGLQCESPVVRSGSELRAVRYGRRVVVGLLLFAAGERGVHHGAGCERRCGRVLQGHLQAVPRLDLPDCHRPLGSGAVHGRVQARDSRAEVRVAANDLQRHFRQSRYRRDAVQRHERSATTDDE